MKKKVTIGILLIVLALSTVFIIRLISGEDNWVCEEGIWVKHGNPTGPMPSKQCSTVK